MTFVVAPECFQLGLRAGGILFRNLRVTETDTELRAEIAREIPSLRTRFPDPQAVRDAPDVLHFAEVLRRVGVNPRREQPSLQRLLTFALKRGDLPAINNFVDAYNLVSVRTGLSLGAHDVDKITVPISLRMMTGSEVFTPLGSGRPEAVPAGEFGYVDAESRVLCRLDIRQAEFSKVTRATTTAFLIVEGTAAHDPATLDRATDESAALITRFCGGTAQVVARPV